MFENITNPMYFEGKNIPCYVNQNLPCISSQVSDGFIVFFSYKFVPSVKCYLKTYRVLHVKNLPCSAHSNTGKQLMAKCRLLIKENEELGRVISSGKLAKLEGDIALQRNFTEELKKSQSGGWFNLK